MIRSNIQQMVQVVLQILKNVLFLVEFQLKRIKDCVKELNFVSLLTKNLLTKSIVVLTLIQKFLKSIHNSKKIIPKKLKHIRKFLTIIPSILIII
jgi:hypothetical protein